MKFFRTRPGVLARWEAFKKIFTREIRKDVNLLDLGGFDGYVSEKLKRNISGLNPIVVDTDEEGLRIAKSRGLETVAASALDLHFQDNSFDVILCLSLIEHVEDEQKLVEEMRRVLRVGGKVFLITPKKRGVMFPFINKETSRKINVGWGHDRRLGYSFNELKLLFEKYGFVVNSKTEYYNELTKTAYLLTQITSFSSFLKLVSFVVFYFTIKLEPYFKYKTDSQLIIFQKVK